MATTAIPANSTQSIPPVPVQATTPSTPTSPTVSAEASRYEKVGTDLGYWSRSGIAGLEKWWMQYGVD